MTSARLRIGLLGGSFNPAHAGHLHISREALKRLRLDRIWWLVSPQNPLKATQGMAPYAERFAFAKTVAAPERRIEVSDFEQRHHLHFTYAALEALIRAYPKVEFVWIMGADNLASFHRWQRWRAIARLVPMAVFDRAPFSHTALRGKAAIALARLRLRDVASVVGRPGHWVYMYILTRRHAASSTAIRATRNNAAKKNDLNLT